MLFLGAIITYDLVFMTDTKHALLMMPFAFLPVLFHGSVPLKTRLALLGGGALVTALGLVYVVTFMSSYQLSQFANIMADSPKGDAYRAVTQDFPYLVPYPMLGAGPGRFFSQQAADAGAPLARRYVIPYVAEAQRAKVAHTGMSTGGSLLAWPQCDALLIAGEFGWLGGIVYLAFVLWTFAGLWRKASANRGNPEQSGIYLALAAGMLFLNMTMLFSSTCTVPCLMFPWWMLIGRMWDMKPDSSGDETGNATDALIPGRPVSTLLEIPETS